MNSLKLRRIMPGRLEHAAATGMCGPDLWAFVKGLCLFAKADIANNEGHTSLIKGQCQRTRNIGLPLLSARCNIKRELGIGTRGACTRWSQVRDSAAQILQNATDSYQDGVMVHSEPNRWSAPSAAAVPQHMRDIANDPRLDHRYARCRMGGLCVHEQHVTDCPRHEAQPLVAQACAASDGLCVHISWHAHRAHRRFGVVVLW